MAKSVIFGSQGMHNYKVLTNTKESNSPLILNSIPESQQAYS